MSLKNVANPKMRYLNAAEDLRENPGQWRAYNCEGNCVVLAGPGSGKKNTYYQSGKNAC